MHSENKASEARTVLINTIVNCLDSTYDLLDYSNCYYEGDTPSINRQFVHDQLEKILDAFSISNK